MNKLKKIIIIVSIIFIIIVIGLIVVNSKKKENKPTQNNPNNIVIQEVEDIRDEELKDNIEISEYILVRDCINSYLDNLNKNNNSSNKVYNLLDQQYISRNEISLGNITEKINFVDKKEEIVVTEVSRVKQNSSNTVKTYLVNGLIKDESNNKIGEDRFLVNTYISKKTFSIEPVTTDFDKNSLKEIEVIEKNDDNTYTTKVVHEQTRAEEYFNWYKSMVLVEPEVIYKKLDGEYIKKYDTLDRFKEYVSNNKERIQTAEFKGYRIDKGEKYTQYVCQDQRGFFYIFNKTGKMDTDFNIYIDTYTKALIEFENKYSKETEENKISINIGRVIEAINSKDYEYIYNKLDQSFKENYYPNVDSVKKFFEQNTHKYNKIVEANYENNAGVYIYKLKLAFYDNNNYAKKDLTVVMKLLDENDFTMSFSNEKTQVEEDNV